MFSTGMDPEPPKEPEMDEADEKIGRLNQLLAGLEEGWTILITRIKPSWAKGILEETDVSLDNPLDLDYLVKTWGGHLLQIQVRNDKGQFVRKVHVPLFSFEPKAWGKRVKPPWETEQEEKPQINPLGTLDSLVNIAEKLKGNNNNNGSGDSVTKMILELLLKQNTKQTEQPQATSPVDQLVHMAHAFQTLKGIFGSSDEQPNQSGVESDLLSQVGGLLDTYERISSKAKPASPTITPPAQLPPGEQNLPKNLPTVDTISSDLSALAVKNPKEATEALALAMGKLPENKREELLQNVFEMFGIIEEEMDESDNSSDEEIKSHLTKE